MKNIRNKVFETNSSSTHSISIYNATQGLYDTIVPNSKGVIALVGGEFGWEWEKYNDAETKANYAAVFAKDNQQMTDMLEQVIKDHTGAKKVDLSGVGGYIDHQSALSEGGDALKAFDTPQTLKNFIFHPESWLFTGNDNDSEPSNFYDVEFGIVYTHQVEVEGSSVVEKVQDEPDEDTLKEILGRIMDRHPLCVRNYNYDAFEYEEKDNFTFVSWDRKASDGSVYSSFDKIKENKLTLFVTKSVYSSDKERNYKGEDVIKSKDIGFTIRKL